MIKKLIGISLLLFAIFIIVGFIPVKFAVKMENADYNSSEYIICKETKVTDYYWTRIIECSDLLSEYDTQKINMVGEDFNFVDKTPLDSYFTLGLDKVYANNIYVVYGEKLSKEMYTCEEWDIIYPVRRNGILNWILPKNYLCIFDLIGLP